MSQTYRLGLGNSLDKETTIVHTTILGKNTLGRISDLCIVWCEKEGSVQDEKLASIRILLQSLLEFAHPARTSASGYLEYAIENENLYLAIRCQNTVEFGEEHPEKMLTQYWLNSPSAQILKKNLSPFDRVEVRYHPGLKLVEWRVCRPLVSEVVNEQESTFKVLLDENKEIASENQNYVDSGDLPYQDWLKDVYHSKDKNKSGSGDVLINGSSSQEEEEWARVVSAREDETMETEVRFNMSETPVDEKIVIRHVSNEDENAINEKSDQYLHQLNERLKTEKYEMHAEAKKAVLEAKRNELKANREAQGLNQKVLKLATLMKQKELNFQKALMKIKLLEEKQKETEQKVRALAREQEVREQEAREKLKESTREIAGDAGGVEKTGPDRSLEFRNKALAMYENLRKAKEEIKVLRSLLPEAVQVAQQESTHEPAKETQKEIHHEVNDETNNGVNENEGTREITKEVTKDVLLEGSTPVKEVHAKTLDGKEGALNAAHLQIEDLTKKLERTSRALEAEKVKIKTLSERTIAAEKEAQSAGPMVQDLEKKVENALKTVQLSKKETEQVKQKLVQSEAEKNKVKNELVKAEAQIKTLMKRHAA